MLAILTGFFVMTGCNSDNDQPVSDGTIVGKWRLIAIGDQKVSNDYYEEITFDVTKNGTYFVNNHGEITKENFTYEFKDADNSPTLYLRIYSKKIPFSNGQYIDYLFKTEGNIMRLNERDVDFYTDATRVYQRMR